MSSDYSFYDDSAAADNESYSPEMMENNRKMLQAIARAQKQLNMRSIEAIQVPSKNKEILKVTDKRINKNVNKLVFKNADNDNDNEQQAEEAEGQQQQQRRRTRLISRGEPITFWQELKRSGRMGRRFWKRSARKLGQIWGVGVDAVRGIAEKTRSEFKDGQEPANLDEFTDSESEGSDTEGKFEVRCIRVHKRSSGRPAAEQQQEEEEEQYEGGAFDLNAANMRVSRSERRKLKERNRKRREHQQGTEESMNIRRSTKQGQRKSNKNRAAGDNPNQNTQNLNVTRRYNTRSNRA